MRISKAQKELHEAMLNGVLCHATEVACLRTDKIKRCGATLKALEKKGLVEMFAEFEGGRWFRSKENADIDGGDLRAAIDQEIANGKIGSLGILLKERLSKKFKAALYPQIGVDIR